MTAMVAWRIGVALAVLAGAYFIYDLIGDNARMRDQLGQAAKAVQRLNDRAALLEIKMADNEKHDSEVRRQQQTVRVVVDDARKSNVQTAQLLDTVLPDSLRKRVFDNPDPTSGTAVIGDAPAPGSD